jgi:hypothetical protein
MMNTSRLPFASIATALVDYLDCWLRVIGLFAKQANIELLVQTPDIHSFTPHNKNTILRWSSCMEGT